MGSLEPVHPVTLVLRGRIEKSSEREDKVLRVGRTPPMESSGRRKDDSGMVFAGRRPIADDGSEILGVFGHDRPVIKRRPPEQLFVVKRRQLGIHSARQHVMSAVTQLSGRIGGVVDVEEQLHVARRPWRRRHAASASSAAARLAVISESISLVKSA